MLKKIRTEVTVARKVNSGKEFGLPEKAVLQAETRIAKTRRIARC